MKLYILRHGHSISNITAAVSCKPPGLGLSEKGIQQAKDVTTEFLDKKIEKVFVSSFLRTIETADIVCPVIGIKKYYVDERVREHDFGEWDGKNGDQMAPDLIKHLQLSDQGKIDINFTKTGETQRNFFSRVYGWLNELKDTDYENVLLITHASPAAIITRLYSKITNTKQIGGDLKNCEYIVLDLNGHIFKEINKTVIDLNE